jgi:di/tricarboxylate transporter
MVTHLFMQNRNLQQIFKWPIILGVLTLLGLIIALLEDGLLEDFSLLALSVPIAVIIYFYYYRD